MCTLIIARDVLGPRTMLLGANRDEDPRRPSDPPAVLLDVPRLVGGRDRVAGGTWLALRDGVAAIALLNRRDPEATSPPEGRRSRGLLTLDAAAAPPEPRLRGEASAAGPGDDLARGVLAAAGASIAAARYAPFSLVYASATDCRVMVFEGQGAPRVSEIGSGWHVLTHADLDDPSEPRAAHLVARLARFAPGSLEEAEAFLTATLRSHAEGGEPPVCLHRGRMVTVSASWIWMDGKGTRYFHADGPPCQRPFVDHTPLLLGAAPRGGRK